MANGGGPWWLPLAAAGATVFAAMLVLFGGVLARRAEARHSWADKKATALANMNKVLLRHDHFTATFERLKEQKAVAQTEAEASSIADQVRALFERYERLVEEVEEQGLLTRLYVSDSTYSAFNVFFNSPKDDDAHRKAWEAGIREVKATRAGGPVLWWWWLKHGRRTKNRSARGDRLASVAHKG